MLVYRLLFRGAEGWAIAEDLVEGLAADPPTSYRKSKCRLDQRRKQRSIGHGVHNTRRRCLLPVPSPCLRGRMSTALRSSICLPNFHWSGRLAMDLDLLCD